MNHVTQHCHPPASGTWQSPFRYGGPWGYQDDNDAYGLKVLGYRYYDATAGRFLSRDVTKDGRNWFTYCENDPISMADPSGLLGHHYVPYGVYSSFKLSKQAVDYFSKFTSGYVPDHYYDKPHRDYSKAVAAKLKKYLRDNRISPSKMTRFQAEAFGKLVLNSRVPAIRNYLSALRRKIAIYGAHQASRAAANKGARRLGKRLLSKVPFIGAFFFGSDIAEGGFGHALNEALWPLSEVWR